MSDTLAQLRDSYAALNRRDIEGTVAVLDEDAKWVEHSLFPWLWLNPRVVKAAGQTRAAVAAEAAKFLASRANVARTFTPAELLGTFPESDELGVLVKRSFHPARCGDVYVVPSDVGAALALTLTRDLPPPPRDEP